MDYGNGTKDSYHHQLFWCKPSQFGIGVFSGECIVYNPAGSRETATTTGNLTISDPMKNVTNELKQLIPTEPASDNPSPESNQPKHLVPLTPPDDTVSDKGVGGDSDEQPTPSDDESDQEADEKDN